jgi:hypothetical protein
LGTGGDFWLKVHDIASDLARDGENLAERRSELARAFQSMSPPAREVLKASFDTLYAELRALSPLIDRPNE